MCDSKFLDHLERIEGAAMAGFGDIALLSALVLPDVLGMYLCKVDKISAKKSKARYVECLRQSLLHDLNERGFARLAVAFGFSGRYEKDFPRVSEYLYALRCSLAHGANMRVQNMKPCMYCVCDRALLYPYFMGVASVHHIQTEMSVLHIDVNRLIEVLCSMFRQEYLTGDANLKTYLDDFDRSVYRSSDKRGLVRAFAASRISLERGES